MALNVKFYSRPVHNEFQSDKQGRPIFEMVDFCRVEIPGMVANVVDDPASEQQKREFAVEWAHYLNQKETGVFTEHTGTLLSDWPQLNAAQVLELRHFKFYTVEQVADAGDGHIMAIGMAAGMSPYSLRDKAKAWLSAALEKTDVDAAQERAAELTRLRSELEDMRQMIGKSIQAPKNKGGRPRKPPAEPLAA